ncbi:MAG: DUF488 domain-containing protein [Actinomycetaceae bacterium]|nr:DUF488 domain-containing protein [Actinomycetaceae bacterium]
MSTSTQPDSKSAVSSDSAQEDSAPTIFTIGHSTRSLAEFVSLLKEFGVTLVIDIRTAAGSRRNPQYGKGALDESLPAYEIAYERLKELGGFRKTSDDSPNKGWRNASFRGFADYMQTDGFAHGLAALIERARTDTVAIMCAEAVPWRCHRSLIADALVIRGIRVLDIMGARKATAHKLTRFAVIDGMHITYPPYE